MTATVQIRAATGEDSALLSALAMRSKAHWGYSKEFMDACRDELAVAPTDIESTNFVFAVAAAGTEILGYYALEKASSSPWDLAALFIEPEAIGQGIGKQLLRHAMRSSAAAGVDKILIQSDPYAAPFYRAAGASEQGQRESGSIPGRFLPIFSLDVTNA